jgi:molybdate transport system substrate-binding protein
LAAEVNAAEVKVLSAGAMRGILQELAPAFETAAGHKLKIDYATAGVVEQKVAADDEIDVAILTKPRVDKLVREAKIVGGTTKTLASAQIGLAVKKGATKPDISSVEAFKRALLNAKSVAYADPATGATSGAYLAQAVEKLGISAELKPKTRLVSAGTAQGLRVICRLRLAGEVVEAATAGDMASAPADQRLPAADDRIDIGRVELQSVAAPASALGGHHSRTAAEKGIEHDLAADRPVEDRVGDHSHRLHGRMQRRQISLLAAAGEGVVGPYGRAHCLSPFAASLSRKPSPQVTFFQFMYSPLNAVNFCLHRGFLVLPRGAW